MKILMRAQKREKGMVSPMSKGRRLMPFVVLVSGLLLAASGLNAAFSSKSAGTSGAAFLKIGAGARPVAMAGAYTAVADDVNSIYWNTAGLASLKEKNEFVAMRAELFQGLEYNFFAFAHPMKEYGTIAVGLNNLNVTDIEQRSGDTDAADSKFSSNDSAYTLAYALKVTALGLPGEEEDGGLHVGAGVKYIRQTLAGETANTMGGDAGLLYRFSARPLAVGLAVQNLGAKSKFKSEGDPLPVTIKMGTSYRLGEMWRLSGVKDGGGQKTGLLLAIDGNFPRDNDASIHGGMEFTHGWSEKIATSVRSGYETGKSRQVEGTGSGVSAGAGITYKFFSFDFAWVPFGNLGNTFRYSVKLKF